MILSIREMLLNAELKFRENNMKIYLKRNKDKKIISYFEQLSDIRFNILDRYGMNYIRNKFASLIYDTYLKKDNRFDKFDIFKPFMLVYDDKIKKIYIKQEKLYEKKM